MLRRAAAQMDLLAPVATPTIGSVFHNPLQAHPRRTLLQQARQARLQHLHLRQFHRLPHRQPPHPPPALYLLRQVHQRLLKSGKSRHFHIASISRCCEAQTGTAKR